MSYNLFRRLAEPGVICAVPETEPVPGFIDGRWEFCGRVLDTARAPKGFQPHAAPGAVRLSGFYVFHDFRFRSAEVARAEAGRAAPATAHETRLAAAL